MSQNRTRHTSVALGGLLLAGLLTGTVYGQAPQDATPRLTDVAPATPAATPDKVVLKVGEEQFTQADVDFLIGNLNPQAQRTLATQGRRSLGEQYAAMVLLSQQALSHHLDTTPTYLRQLAIQRRQLLAQAAYDELQRQAAVTPEEVGQYFSAHQTEFDEAQLRQVIVRKRPEGANEGTPGLSPQDARARAESVRKALATAADAKKVAQELQVPNEVLIDVEPRAVRRGGMRPEMDKVAFQLRDGEVSEIFDVPQALVFFQVVGRRHLELKDASPQIENTLRQQKVEAAVAELKKKTAVWMDDQYFAPPSTSPAAATSTGPPPSQPPKP